VIKDVGALMAARCLLDANAIYRFLPVIVEYIQEQKNRSGDRASHELGPERVSGNPGETQVVGDPEQLQSRSGSFTPGIYEPDGYSQASRVTRFVGCYLRIPHLISPPHL
jgi:hypothetical protein